jgi:hypothetical protein
MDCKIEHSQGHSIISLWYGMQNTIQSEALFKISVVWTAKYCTVGGIVYYHCDMDCKIQHSQGHSIISLWYGLQNTAQSRA